MGRLGYDRFQGTLRWKHVSEPQAGTSQALESPYQRYGHTAVEYRGCAYVWGGRSDVLGASNTMHACELR